MAGASKRFNIAGFVQSKTVQLVTRKLSQDATTGRGSVELQEALKALDNPTYGAGEASGSGSSIDLTGYGITDEDAQAYDSPKVKVNASTSVEETPPPSLTSKSTTPKQKPRTPDESPDVVPNYEYLSKSRTGKRKAKSAAKPKAVSSGTNTNTTTTVATAYDIKALKDTPTAPPSLENGANFSHPQAHSLVTIETGTRRFRRIPSNDPRCRSIAEGSDDEDEYTTYEDVGGPFEQSCSPPISSHSSTITTTTTSISSNGSSSSSNRSSGGSGGGCGSGAEGDGSGTHKDSTNTAAAARAAATGLPPPPDSLKHSPLVTHSSYCPGNIYEPVDVADNDGRPARPQTMDPDSHRAHRIHQQNNSHPHHRHPALATLPRTTIEPVYEDDNLYEDIEVRDIAAHSKPPSPKRDTVVTTAAYSRPITAITTSGGGALEKSDNCRQRQVVSSSSPVKDTPVHRSAPIPPPRRFKQVRQNTPSDEDEVLSSSIIISSSSSVMETKRSKTRSPRKRPSREEGIRFEISVDKSLNSEGGYAFSQPNSSDAVAFIQTMDRLSVEQPDETDALDASDSEDSGYVYWSDMRGDEEEVESASKGSDVIEDDRDGVYENVGDDKRVSATPSDWDKVHLIAHELMTTEETYVKRLGVLVQIKDKTAKILGESVAKEMFPSLDSMYALHRDNMLQHLQERLHLWESHKRIGDIMKRFAPFLKLYTEYVSRFAEAMKQVEVWCDKSPEFTRYLNSFPEGPVGSPLTLKLQLQSHMLEPIQRVPRYELLLKQYLKYLKEESPDRADVQTALASVSQAARHFEDTMKRGTKADELIEIQSVIDSPINLVTHKRELVKQGKIYKVNATTGKVVSRYAFLFNDLFMLCRENIFYIPGVNPKYKVKQFLEVDGMQITEGDNLDLAYTFYVRSRKAILELCGSTEQDKSDWEKALWEAVDTRTRQRLSKSLYIPRLAKDGADGHDLGKLAPLWVHNSQVSQCMLCSTDFKGFKKKHHCRACGAVVCNKCSARTSTLEYDDSHKQQRVCDECYLILEDNFLTPRRSSTFFHDRGHEVCVHSGYTQLSNDAGNTWFKRWMEVHEGGVLFCFKAQQDVRPISSVQLTCCRITWCTATSHQRLIRVTTDTSKTYYLNGENLKRWFEVLRTAS